MKIEEILQSRNIKEVVHFTTERGLTGCAATKTVLSRKRLDKNKYLSHIASPVSKERKEASQKFNKEEDWLDYINMSISEINAHYYHAANGWFKESDAWWCIMSFTPEILTHEGVYFTTTNNIYTGVKRNKGIKGLQEMFADKITRWSGNNVIRGSRASHLTTCEQAEVLYPSTLDMKFLNRVYVTNEDQAASIYGTLRSLGFSNIDVIIKPEKFNGIPNAC
ncbi:DarT ssDNA thymidine ADP-ribosyltransferase family protein [Edwardsiella tarda]|uniref:DarT ssDNA thymidine ADP-ribosyltransferase family protein n=1 Tax=Edwardsiella tarda TaxID=636 RepID=UPI00351C9278